MTQRKFVAAPEELNDEDRSKLLVWYVKKRNRGDLPRISKPDLRRLMEACLIWHRSRGITRVDWYATVQQWVVKQAELDGFRPAKSRRSPQSTAKQTSFWEGQAREDKNAAEANLERLGDLLTDGSREGSK